MNTKVNTISFGSVKAYAKVNDRLMEFRAQNPNGLIETTPTITETSVIFKARIVKDKNNPASAEATGHAYAEVKGSKDKAFEKLETVAVGRALALLGYGADGEIASSEEMEELLALKQEKIAEDVFNITESIGNCTTEAQLVKIWSSLSGEMKKLVLEAKNAKKAELTKTDNETA